MEEERIVKAWLASMGKRLALIAVLAAGVFGYTYYDKSANYHPVRATVTGVEQLCYLYKKGYKTKTTTNDLPCDVIKEVQARGEEYKDFEIRRKTMKTVSYELGGQTYTSRREPSMNDEGKPIAPGDAIKVLVSNEDPSKA